MNLQKYGNMEEKEREITFKEYLKIVKRFENILNDKSKLANNMKSIYEQMHDIVNLENK